MIIQVNNYRTNKLMKSWWMMNCNWNYTIPQVYMPIEYNPWYNHILLLYIYIQIASDSNRKPKKNWSDFSNRISWFETHWNQMNFIRAACIEWWTILLTQTRMNCTSNMIYPTYSFILNTHIHPIHPPSFIENATNSYYPPWSENVHVD